MITSKHPATRNLNIVYTIIVVLCLAIALFILQALNLVFPDNLKFKVGTPIDSLNHVVVYYNGETSNVTAKNISKDGYNIGLQWQCVEFVKRYYYEHFNHVMPVPGGNAKDIFDRNLPDASYNEKRDLVQYSNASLKKPAVNDILVFDGHLGNKYGHIAIISKVSENSIEIIQQNAGPDAPSREELKLVLINDRWKVMNRRVLGWMRIE